MIGAERTTVYPIVEEAAKRYNFTISPDPNPSAGHYYRSDHFSFARVGIPAFSVDGGEDIIGKPPGTGHKLREEFDDIVAQPLEGKIALRHLAQTELSRPHPGFAPPRAKIPRCHGRSQADQEEQYQRSAGRYGERECRRLPPLESPVRHQLAFLVLHFLA